MSLFRWVTFDFLAQQHQEEEEEEDDNEDDVQFFTWVVRWGEENLRHFLDEARNDPDTLRQFMMRFV